MKTGKLFIWIGLALTALGGYVLAQGFSLRDPAFVASLKPGAGEAGCNTLRNLYTNSPTGFNTIGTFSFNDYWAQHVYSSNDYSACKVSVPLEPVGSPIYLLYLSIWNTGTDGDGGPTTINGVESSGLDASTIAAGTNYYSFTVSGTSLTNNASYYIVIRSSAADSDDYIRWIRSNANRTNSIKYSGDGISWSDESETRMLNYNIYSQ